MKIVNQPVNEIITNLHIHTVYSDGSAKHAEIAEIAGQAGLDVIIITDHNIHVRGLQGYYQTRHKPVMLLVGEEVHNQTQQPQRNHLLAIGAEIELAKFAPQTQLLIRQCSEAGGLSFLAHPNDEELAVFGQGEIPWDNWDVLGYTGIELWNGFSELKEVVSNKLTGLFYAFFPGFIAHTPNPKTLERWDNLMKSGNKVVAVCGSDAHAMQMRMGLLRKKILPYAYHFSSINNHVLCQEPLSGEFDKDRKNLFEALRRGNNFIGNDLFISSKGFRFYAQGKNQTAVMGDEIDLEESITLQIKLPEKAECHLLRDGEIIKTFEDKDFFTLIIDKPGTYRVECFLRYFGKRRTWIISNPIYVRKKRFVLNKKKEND